MYVNQNITIFLQTDKYEINIIYASSEAFTAVVSRRGLLGCDVV
jgi:hypothetical protein